MEDLAIPPIGTTEYPFLGSFNGNGKIVSGFTTANAQSLLEKRPTNAQFQATNNLLSTFDKTSSEEAGAVIGFFGVVGDYNGAADRIRAKITADGLTGDSAVFNDTDITVQNVGLNDFTIDNRSGATTIGLAAGYVNALMVNVLVNDCTMTASGSGSAIEQAVNLSNHALVGYCTAEFEASLGIYEVNLSDPTSTTTANINDVELGADWGGSIAMDTLYDNLVLVRDNSANNTGIDYAWKAVKVRNSDNTSFCGVERVTTQFMKTDNFRDSNGNSIKDRYSVMYTFANQMVNETFMIAGGAMVSEVVCEQTNSTVNAYVIKYGSEYLNVELGGGMPTIGLGNDRASATRWVLLDNGTLFVLTSGIKLYVNVVIGSEISFSYIDHTKSGWSYVEDKGLCYTADGKSYYLKLINDAWELREEDNTASYYVIKSGDNYLIGTEDQLSPQAPYFSGNLHTTNSNDPNITPWYTSANDNGVNVYTTIKGAEVYLVNGMLYDETINQYRFLLDSQAVNIPWTIDANGYLSSNGQYVVCNDGIWSLSSNATNAAIVTPVTLGSDDNTVSWSYEADEVNDMSFDTTDAEEYDSFEFGVANKYDAAYIPLQKKDDNTPEDHNTGYITGGMYNHISSSNPEPQQNIGDVRASSFYVKNVLLDKNGNRKETLHACINGSFTDIAFNATNESSGLKKYEEAYNGTGEDGSNFKDLISVSENAADPTNGINNKRLYGLQFVDGMISTSSLITIPEATVNRETIQNYQVPADCIDFTLRQKGYINFFAGTYYPNTNCFFSLHHIIRNGNKITEIKEIQRIYESGSGTTSTYVYEYKGDTNFDADGLTLVFNTDWLTSPTEIIAQGDSDINSDSIHGFRGDIYYFEIPVNAGEYALGSVEGKIGACLLYLDIGASAQDIPANVDRTEIHEVFTEGVASYNYPEGVGLMDGSTYAEMTGEYISLKGESVLNATINRVGDQVTVSGSGLSLNASHGYTVSGVSSATASPTVPKITKRVSYIDKDVDFNTTYIFIVTFIDLNGDGTYDPEGGDSITLTNDEGIAVEGIELTNTNDETSFKLPTHTTPDRIKWEDIKASSTSVLSYRYSSDGTVTNSFEYSHTAKTYTVSISSDVATTVTVTDVNSTENVVSSSINGSTASKDANIDITESTP